MISKAVVGHSARICSLTVDCIYCEPLLSLSTSAPSFNAHLTADRSEEAFVAYIQPSNYGEDLYYIGPTYSYLFMQINCKIIHRPC